MKICTINILIFAGPDILTYKEQLYGFAKVRGLKRWILTVPVMTPRLSSYWLFFVTSTSYNLAVALVNSMKINVVASSNEICTLLEHQPASYETSLERAFLRIEQNAVISSWKDSLIVEDLKIISQNISKCLNSGALEIIGLQILYMKKIPYIEFGLLVVPLGGIMQIGYGKLEDSLINFGAE